VVWHSGATPSDRCSATGEVVRLPPVVAVGMRSAAVRGPDAFCLGGSAAWASLTVWATAAGPHDAGPSLGMHGVRPEAAESWRPARRRTGPLRVGLRAASLALLAAFLVTWFLYFRPQFLGGPASFVGVNGISMTPTLHLGDLAIVEKHASYHVGEIIVYRIPKGDPGAGDEVIHRIVGGNGRTGFVTKGDHNSYTDHFWHPKTKDVIGAVWFHIPRGALILSKLHDPVVLAVVVAVLTLAVLVWPMRRRTRRAGAEAPVDETVVLRVPDRPSKQAA